MANSSSSSVDTQRRLLLAGAVAGVAATATATAGNKDHSHHHHGEAANQELVNAALACIEASERCLEHCTRLVQEGDTSIAECMRKVSETIPMCQALVKLGIYESDHLAALAAVCIDVCGDCEKECLKHKKHAACKRCADSCAECINACKKIV